MQTDMVREFHIKHGFPLDQRLSIIGCEVPLGTAINFSRQTSSMMERHSDTSLLAYRLHLIFEELTELMEGVSEHDRVGTADSVADLLYVVIGFAETYGLPWEHLLQEVHKSNMTKKVRTADNPRMRDKGPDYVPPNIAAILAFHDKYD